MIDKILNFIQTNIIHIGYWIIFFIFGSVIKSIVKGEKSRLDKIKEKLKDKFKKTGEPQTATKEEIDSLFPKEQTKEV